MSAWPPAPDGKGGLLPPPDVAAFGAWLDGRQAEGAYPNGARIVKEPGDANDRTPLGTPGTVRGSYAHTQTVNGRTIHFCYVVVWDGCPDALVMLTDFKIKLLE